MFLKVTKTPILLYYATHGARLTTAFLSFFLFLCFVLGNHTEDAGFHRALKELMVSAKWPMILTSNQPPRSLRDVSCYIRHVSPCPVPQMAALLAMVWAVEGLPSVPPSAFSLLASNFSGDIRSAIMNLQLLAANPLDLLKYDQYEAVMPPVVAPSQSSSKVASELTLFGYKFPRITHVRPFTGRTEGGAKIHVHGMNFLQVSSSSSSAPEDGEAASSNQTYAPVEILIGCQPCLDVVVVSDQKIQARVPPSFLNKPSQYPVVVKLCRFISSQAILQEACQAVYRYQDKQVCIDELFPELKVPNQRRRLIINRGDDQQEEEDVAIDASNEEQQVDTVLEHPPVEGERALESGSRRDPSFKRRKVVVESDDEEEEWIDPSAQPVSTQEINKAEQYVEHVGQEKPLSGSQKDGEETKTQKEDVTSIERTYREAFR